MKKEINKGLSVIAILLVFSVILNLVFVFYFDWSKPTTTSEDETQLEAVIVEKKIEIESLKLQLEQMADNVQSDSDNVTENSSDSNTGKPPVTADDNGNVESDSEDTSSTSEIMTGYKAVAESFLDALMAYSSDDMDSRNERLKSVISGSQITSKLIMSGASSDMETDNVSGNTSWQTEYSSRLVDSQIYISYSNNMTVAKALADVSYTLTDELGTMTVSAYISIELEHNDQGEYKVTGYEIMSKN